MTIEDVIAWVRSDNLSCPFADDPSECDEAEDKARELQDHIRSLCEGDDPKTLEKVMFIIHNATYTA